jgi:hypothetical protein
MPTCDCHLIAQLRSLGSSPLAVDLMESLLVMNTRAWLVSRSLKFQLVFKISCGRIPLSASICATTFDEFYLAVDS